MPSTVENLSPTRARITIEVPFSELEPAIRQAYRDLGGQLSIPGFRKGHIPAAMIDARVGRAAVLNEAVNAVLPEIYAKAVETHSLIPLGRPQIDISQLEDGVKAEFTAEVDVVAEFKLPDFSKIQIEVAPIGDLDEMVEERISLLRERFAQVLDVDRVARTGDQVVVDLSAAQNGQALPGANAESLSYVIGSGGMLEGLDEAVIGCAAGDERTFESTLAGGDHQGQSADVTVTITKVQSRTLPDVDDEFAQMVSQFDTVEQMRADLRQAVERMAGLDQLGEIRNKVLDEMIAMTDFELPEGLVNDEVASRSEQITEELKAAGLSLEDYLARRSDPETRTTEQFFSSIQDSVTRGIRAEILLDRVADAEKIVVGQEDLTNYVFQRAQENGTTPQEEIERMRSQGLLPRWMTQIRQAKALDSVASQAKAKDADGKPINLTAVKPAKGESISPQG